MNHDCTFDETAEPNNPVHRHEDGTWWFYEETWADENGPYDTLELCNWALKEYVKVMQG